MNDQIDAATAQLERLDEALMNEFRLLEALHEVLKVMEQNHGDTLNAEFNQVSDHLHVLAMQTQSLVKRIAATQARIRAVAYMGSQVAEGLAHVFVR